MQSLKVARLGQQLEAHTRGTLPFGASVLVPRFDLCVRQVELGRQLLPVLDAQVLLFLEAPLQRLQLVICKGRACLSLLPGIAVNRAGATAAVATRFV